MKSTATATTNNYLGRVLNTLGVQAARKMKAKHRAMVSIKDLASTLKSFKSKCELMQLTSSVNHLIKMGIVELVLPECVNKSLKEVGLGGKLCTNHCSQNPVSQGVNLGTQFYGSNPIPTSKMSMLPYSQPRLSPGIVHTGNGLPLNKLCGSGSCRPYSPACGDCCCRPRLSVGVVYPGEGMNQLAGNNLGFNQLCGGSCGSCNCRPRLSVGVVYPN
uniref:Uncharacterized protein n=1 Tax=Cacopsylla melanoneura TaxID=428564 RepID=A0A8D9B142_9HEMI